MYKFRPHPVDHSSWFISLLRYPMFIFLQGAKEVEIKCIVLLFESFTPVGGEWGELWCLYARIGASCTVVTVLLCVLGRLFC